MKSNINTLIIPDVHGRSFWMDPVVEVLANTDAMIVFLGDYLDPYPDEWEDNVDYRRVSIQRLEQILELKRLHPERIILLIGNHDCGYCIGDDICSSRMDRRNAKEIGILFEENRDLFQLASECDIAGKHFIFSHAGILKGWADRVWGEEEVAGPAFNVVEELNEAWRKQSYGILNSLGDYDRYRGWGGYQYASPVWSDIRSWIYVKPEETFGYNIVGHTQCNSPVILDTIADLDCRKAFYIDDQGDIRDFLSGEKQEMGDLKSDEF